MCALKSREGCELQELWLEHCMVLDLLGITTASASVLLGSSCRDVDECAMRLDDHDNVVPARLPKENVQEQDLTGVGCSCGFAIRYHTHVMQVQSHMCDSLPDKQSQDLELLRVTELDIPMNNKTIWTSRYYEDEHDLLNMQGMLMEARSQTDDWRYPHIGDLLFWFFMVVCHLDPQEHIRIWFDDQRLIGYAILGEDPSFDWQVLPEYSWLGIENEALAWAETRLSKLRKEDPQRWGGNSVSSSRQDDTERIKFLEEHGYRPGGEFSEVNMLCWLDERIPEYVLPAGFQIRAIADAEAGYCQAEISNRAKAQRDVWQPWTVGNVSDENYAYFMTLPGYYRDLDVVAVAPDGIMAAYVNGWIDPINRIGDFGPVGARPAYRRLGLTRAVLLESLRRMKGYGMNRVSVSTGVSNTPAIRLYESVGFRIVNQYLEYVRSDR
jgi:mycothiol synthase